MYLFEPGLRSCVQLQGYLAHNHHPARAPEDPKHRPTVGSWGVAFSVKRGTSVIVPTPAPIKLLCGGACEIPHTQRSSYHSFTIILETPHPVEPPLHIPRRLRTLKPPALTRPPTSFPHTRAARELSGRATRHCQATLGHTGEPHSEETAAPPWDHNKAL